MKVKVRVFMEYRQRLGWAEREVELPDGATVAELLKAIGLPDAVEELRQGRGIILRNGRNVLLSKGADEPLSDGDTVVVFPPAGGG